MANRIRVLVVDDDADMRGLLTRELDSEGYEVTDAADAPGAVRACRARSFDVILMDNNMPGQDGLDILPGLRTMCPSTPIIMMTAFGDVPAHIEATERGAADFLIKPFRIDELMSAIKRALA
jgi:DNA-binding NtrC family response regulator